MLREGEPGSELFFLLDGQVDCIYQTDDHINHAVTSSQAGDSFGGIAMFFNMRNITSFQAADVECNLFMLEKADLMEALSGHVEVIHTAPHARLTCNTLPASARSCKQVHRVSRGGVR